MEQNRKHKKKTVTFESLATWKLAVLAAPCALGAFLVAQFFQLTGPLYMEAMRASTVYSWLGLYVSINMALVALQGIAFAAVTKRCGEILYKRVLA